MRTKTEALAHPMAGDRWLLPINKIREIDQVQVEWLRFKTIVKGRRSAHWVRRDSFRRWAANAEYLGGPA